MAKKFTYMTSEFEEMLEKYYGLQYDIQSDWHFNNGFIMYGRNKDGNLCSTIEGDYIDEFFDDFAAMLGLARVTSVRYDYGEIVVRGDPITDEFIREKAKSSFEVKVKKTDADDRANSISKLSVGDKVKLDLANEYMWDMNYTVHVKDLNGNVLGVLEEEICPLITKMLYGDFITIENARVSAVSAFNKKTGALKKRPDLTVSFDIKKK